MSLALLRAFILLLVLVLPALAEGVWGLTRFAGGTRAALWLAVRACLVNHTITGFAFPCLEVNTGEGDDSGYVVLRGLAIPDTVLAPAKRVVGLEDSWLRSADAPDYFEDAWNARRYAKELSPQGIRDGDIALAVNSRLSRTQDQLHIHVGCVSSVARRTIKLAALELSASRWAPIKKEALGVETWAREIEQSSLA